MKKRREVLIIMYDDTMGFNAEGAIAFCLEEVGKSLQKLKAEVQNVEFRRKTLELVAVEMEIDLMNQQIEEARELMYENHLLRWSLHLDQMETDLYNIQTFVYQFLAQSDEILDDSYLQVCKEIISDDATNVAAKLSQELETHYMVKQNALQEALYGVGAIDKKTVKKTVNYNLNNFISAKNNQNAKIINAGGRQYAVFGNINGGYSLGTSDGEIYDITNFTFHPKYIDIELFTDYHNKKFSIDIMVAGKTISVYSSASKVIDFEYIRQITNLQATIYPISAVDTGEILKSYMAELVKDIPVYSVFTKNGVYAQDVNNPLFVSHGLIIGNNRGKFKCNSGRNLVTQEIRNTDEFRRDVLNLFAITKDTGASTMILMHEFLAFLKSTLQMVDIETNTVLVINGESGTGKSSVAEVLYRVYDADKNQKLGAIHDTRTGLEILATMRRDEVFIADDLYETNNVDLKSMESALVYLIRISSNGKSKNRSTQDIHLNEGKSIESLSVFISEYLIGNTSTMARYIGIEFDKDTVDWNLLTYYQKNPLIIPTLVKDFMTYIIENYEFVLRHIKECIEKYRGSITFSHPRFATDMSHLYLVIDLFCDYLYRKLEMDASQNELFKQLLQEHVILSINIYSKKFENEEPYIIFLKKMIRFIELGKVRIVTRDEFADTDEIHGYSDENYIYLLYSPVMEIVKNSISESKKMVRFNEKAISRQLYYKGIIEVAEDTSGNVNKYTKKKSVNGVRKHFLWIKKDGLKKVVEGAFDDVE